ncbi:15-hydroxyprostaglandin dehydrogenase [NAD(+)]-like [Sitophilus oryzae]|uniref:15-hydroxyprostaglandin dehydrogenase [NAD(+)]-like n=1 Tax=Sitophilus oryzae TaxID=7048 RepID=A0A6J2Y8I5_SITOR|nr:15-hydroxyprostaglandin dehydrogenase [NAD(+)]-like [Sitophilus oryzae]
MSEVSPLRKPQIIFDDLTSNMRFLNNGSTERRSFNIAGKVALITGGVSGLGLSFAKDLLKHQLRGLALADINYNLGQSICHELNEEYGEGKVIFINMDVVDMNQFKDAFEETVAVFGNVDILINNAGILDDRLWTKEIAINITGTINGIILGLETYLQKHRTGSEAVIANICSISGIGGKMAFPCPLYTCSKFAVHGLTITFGCPEHFQRTGVRVVAVCPGVTETPLVHNFVNRTLGDPYEKLCKVYFESHSLQRAESCARAMTKVIQSAPPGTLWVSEGDEEPYQYILPDRFKIPKVYME